MKMLPRFLVFSKQLTVYNIILIYVTALFMRRYIKNLEFRNQKCVHRIKQNPSEIYKLYTISLENFKQPVRNSESFILFQLPGLSESERRSRRYQHSI